MLINVLRAITKVDGTPYQRPADADNPRPENMVNITLGWVIVEAILMSADGKILTQSLHLCLRIIIPAIQALQLIYICVQE